MKELKHIKIIIERHEDGYIAYPLGLKGIVVAQGDSYEEAMNDVKSAIQYHIDTSGETVFEEDSPVLDVFVGEAGAAV